MLGLDLSSVVSVVGAVVSIAALASTIRFTLRRHRSDIVNRTLELQLRFYESDLGTARHVGWDLLQQAEESGEPVTFRGLWDSPEVEIRDRFQKLYRVLNFWLALSKLAEEGELDLEHARSAFSYEYSWWWSRLEILIADTNAADEPLPDVFQPFLGSGIQWMPREAVTNLASRRRAEASATASAPSMPASKSVAECD